MPQQSTNSDREMKGSLIVDRVAGLGLARLELRRAGVDPWSPEAGWGSPLGPDGVRVRIEPSGIWEFSERDGETVALELRGVDAQGQATVPTADESVKVFALTPQFGVAMDLMPSPEGASVEEVRIRRRDGQPLGARDLARLGLGGVNEAVNAALSHPLSVEHLGKRWGAVSLPYPGRRGRPPLFYAVVALAYVRALEEDPRAPIAAMIDSAISRGEHITGDEIRARLRRAREHQLLTAAPRGRAGGHLTPKAIKLLRDAGLLKTGDTLDAQH